ncbi:general stress protein [Pseudoroseomonas cervicalis]|uniref:general stress protein n=1 Tax=Teichococcus cervicalis TaxID=204525 RepID=UPI00277D91D6|nr:KGG domain-containing protein [Pseudoroseomonas cervicalis]MDQ1081382.1 general stress protein YciG [Pseudoroseomonas cervicalis]
MANNNTSNRGFASMDENKQRDIASKGGQSVPAEKRPFAQDHELAAEAGRKGGQNSHGGGNASGGNASGGSGSGGNFANDREKASEAGRKGGQNSQGGRS